MLALRFRWLWLALGWLLVIGVCVGSLLPSDVVRAISLYDELLHGGSYFVLMVWFAGLYGRRQQVPLAFGLVALGIALDLAQRGTATRSFEIRDVLANMIGIAIGLALSLSLLAGWCARLERLLPARK